MIKYNSSFSILRIAIFVLIKKFVNAIPRKQKIELLMVCYFFIPFWFLCFVDPAGHSA